VARPPSPVTNLPSNLSTQTAGSKQNRGSQSPPSKLQPQKKLGSARQKADTRG
jgi:hypothetical protein